MVESTKKRTLDAFFRPPPKKSRISDSANGEDASKTHLGVEDHKKEFSNHSTYPFPIPYLSESTSNALRSLPSSIGRAVNHQPDLDLLYFEPYIPRYLERDIFQFLRKELPFYRVEYKIMRGDVETNIRTPRYTTVFGLDATARFDEDGKVFDSKTGMKIADDKNYTKYQPRPMPKCLDDLRISTEAATGCIFNFCLVNYYASGSDSISYHSDDERFLGADPAIASFSLGARRDFLMKHKPIAPNDNAPAPPETKLVKLPLASGDMVLMRGKTQANWLHSIPKRTGKNAEDGEGLISRFDEPWVKLGRKIIIIIMLGLGRFINGILAHER